MKKEEKIITLFNGECLHFNDHLRVKLIPGTKPRIEYLNEYTGDHIESFKEWLEIIDLDEWSLKPPENKKEYIHVYLDHINATCVSSKTKHNWELYLVHSIDPSDVKKFIKTIEV